MDTRLIKICQNEGKIEEILEILYKIRKIEKDLRERIDFFKNEKIEISNEICNENQAPEFET